MPDYEREARGLIESHARFGGDLVARIRDALMQAHAAGRREERGRCLRVVAGESGYLDPDVSEGRIAERIRRGE